MRALSLLAILSVAACSRSAPSAPKTDPSVLLVNLTGDNVKLIWASDAGIDTVIVGPNTTVCQKWLQSFDSLYTKVVDSVSTTHPNAWAQVTTPWVHFSQYPDYFQLDSVMVAPDGQNILITNRLAGTECQ
jgi:hypothetical protein